MSTLAANLRARLNRDELHQLRWLLGLALALLAFWTLFSLDLGGLTWRTLFFVTAVLALLFPGWPGRLPDWMRRWAFILGASALFTEFIATRFDFVSGLVLLVSLLTLSRCLQYRRLREDWQLILLCMFIIILSGVLTMSLLFGLQILLFTLVAMALLFVMNLLERDSERALVTADWKNFHWGQFLRRVKGAVDFRQLLVAGGLFVGLVLVSSLIFVSFPRFQFAQSFSLSSMRGVAGFHRDIKYQDSHGIDYDNSIAFRVDVPKGVQLKTPYWRMIVLDEYRYNGFQLSNGLQYQDYSRHNLVRYSSPNRLAATPSAPAGAQRMAGTFSFFLEGNVSEFLPVLGPFDTLAFSATQAFRANENMKIYQTDQPSTKVLGYQIENMDFGDTIPAGPMDANPNLTLENVDAAREKGAVLGYPRTYFGLPTNDADREILNDLVAQIKAGREDMTEMEFIAAAVNFLREHHGPAMNIDLTRVQHPLVKDLKPNDVLVRWLDSNSPGWCEHFAGSFVLLCRAAGYPARVVAGYRGAVYNNIDNYYSVPQSLAHAWAEVFDEGRRDRWLRVDPSPGANLTMPGMTAASASSDITLQSGWSAFLDGLRMIWYRRVINFDQTDQQELVAKVSEYGKGFGASLEEWYKEELQQIKTWFTQPLTPKKAGILSGLLIVCVVSLLIRRRLRNVWLRVSARLWPHAVRQLEPVRQDAGRWLRRFQPVWQVVAPNLPATERKEWSDVLHDLLTLRYGPPDFPADPAGTFRKARILLRKAKAMTAAQVS